MHAFQYEVPGNKRLYQQCLAELGPGKPEGLVMRLVTKTQSGLRHTMVWESKEAWEHYRDESVRPAVMTVLERAGISPPGGDPYEEELFVVDLECVDRPAVVT